jgi:hypothetical protein
MNKIFLEKYFTILLMIIPFTGISQVTRYTDLATELAWFDEEHNRNNTVKEINIRMYDNYNKKDTIGELVTTIRFNSEGNKTETIEYLPEQIRKVYEYNSSNQLTKITKIGVNKKEEKLIVLVDGIKYNKDGKITSFKEIYNSSFRSKVKILYDKNALPSTIKVELYYDFAMRLVNNRRQTVGYVPASDSKMIRVICQYYKDTEPEMKGNPDFTVIRRYYQLDENDRVIQLSNRNIKESPYNHSFTYDKQGRIKEKLAEYGEQYIYNYVYY